MSCATSCCVCQRALECAASQWLELMKGAASFLGLEEDLLLCLCTCFLVSRISPGMGSVALIPVELDWGSKVGGVLLECSGPNRGCFSLWI